MKLPLALIFCMLLVAVGSSQWLPVSTSEVFPTDDLPTVTILIAQEAIDLIYFEDSLTSNFEHPATFIYQSAALTDTVENIGFRLRGNTSRFAAKKSFKVSFNSFNPGNSWKGFRKLNLNGEHNDPSIMRSRLNWEAASQLNLTHTQASHIKLYINDIYMGLYLNVEHLDATFLDRNFGSDAGNLYKCHWSGNLDWLGADESAYKEAPWGYRIYELKTNTVADDYSGFVHFVDVLNNSSDADFPCAIREVFDVDKYLRTVAFEILIGHWDGYTFNNNNYYLYERPSDGKFEFIEYDLDNTFGIDWFGIDWTEQNIYDYNNDYRPLYERMMEHPEFRQDFSFYFAQIMDQLPPQLWEQRIDELFAQTTEAALEDEFRTFDYGFDDNAFLNSGTEGWGGHVPWGLIPYMESRQASALEQMESFSQPVVAYVDENAPRLTNQMLFEVATPEGATEVIAKLYSDGNLVDQFDLNDSGLEADTLANDNVWTVLTNPIFELEFVDYQVEITRGGVTILDPCEPKKSWLSPLDNGLVLNELMADNDAFIQDNAGEFDDWFELYNNGAAPHQLETFWTTDNLDYPTKFELADETFFPGNYYLMWADKDDEQGNKHANFKLTNTSEELAIVTNDDGALRVVDYIDFGFQNSDESYGRLTDGHPDWVVFDNGNATPNSSNGVVSVTELSNSLAAPFPNPARDIITLPEAGNWKLLNVRGQLINDWTNAQVVDLSALKSGVYLLSSGGRKYRVVKTE